MQLCDVGAFVKFPPWGRTVENLPPVYGEHGGLTNLRADAAKSEILAMAEESEELMGKSNVENQEVPHEA